MFSGWTQLFPWHFNPQSLFFSLFRICCWVHAAVTLPITKSRYSFIGLCSLQQTSGTGWRFRTTDSDGAAFSSVITYEPAIHKPFTYYFALNGSRGSAFMWMAFFCMKSIQSYLRGLCDNSSHNWHKDFATVAWCIVLCRRSGQQNHNDPFSTTRAEALQLKQCKIILY